MSDEEKRTFASKMLRLGYRRWDAFLRGTVSFEVVAAEQIVDLLTAREHREW